MRDLLKLEKGIQVDAWQREDRKANVSARLESATDLHGVLEVTVDVGGGKGTGVRISIPLEALAPLLPRLIESRLRLFKAAGRQEGWDEASEEEAEQPSA